MDMKTAKSGELKKIVHDVIGTVSSRMLINNICTLLDSDHKDLASLKEACRKIEKMVTLFIGADKAQTLAMTFDKALN